jgi:hypothetical protein
MKALCALAAALAASLAFAGPAFAQDEDRFSITPYIWLPTLDGDLRFHIPPQDPAGPEFFPEVKVGPVDYLDNLQGIFMIAGEARFDRVSVFTDFIYIDFSREDARIRTIDGSGPIPPIDVGSTFDLSGELWTLAAGYDLINDDTWRLQAFGGFRYLGVDSRVDWALSGPLGQFPQTGFAESETDSWDGLVGVRGEARMGNWFFPYYADIGAGDSDLTWQALVGVGYRWGWGDLRLDYRYLDYEQGDDNLVQEMTLDGPALGATFRF